LPPRLVGENKTENHAYTIVSPWYDLTQNDGMPVVLLGGDARPIPHGLVSRRDVPHATQTAGKPAQQGPSAHNPDATGKPQRREKK
jgi:hypothetical protein